MGKVPVVATAFAGLTAIRRAPLLLVGAVLAQIVAVAASAASSIALPNDTGGFMAAGGAQIALWLVSYSIVAAGAIRVFTPSKRRQALGLALGSDELRVTALNAIVLVAVGLISLVGLFVLGLLIGPGGSSEAAIVVLIGMLVTGVLVSAFAAKLSLAGAKTVADRGMRLASAWRMTRDQTWRLIGAFALVSVVSLVVFSLNMIAFAVAGESLGLPSDYDEVWGSRYESWDEFLKPVRVVYLLFNIPTMALLYLLWAAPGAVAYRALAGDTAEKQADVFA